MNCEMYERLRVDAAEDAAMQPHVDACPACQAFHQTVQTMDATLPELWTPALPADFATRVTQQARAARVLRGKPWYERWLAGEDVVNLRQAVVRAFSYGGLVGALVGGLTFAGLWAGYAELWDAAHDLPYGSQPLPYASRVSDALPVVIGVLLVLTAVAMLAALRPLALGRLARAAGRHGRWPLLLQGLAGVAVWVLSLEMALGLDVAGLHLGFSYLAVALPQWINMGVWALLSVATLGVLYHLMTRVASGAPALAAVFYGGLAVLYGIYGAWLGDGAWVVSVGTAVAPEGWSRLLLAAIYYYSPVVLSSWLCGAFALLAGGSAMWLVLLREAPDASQGVRRLALVTCLVGGVALYFGRGTLQDVAPEPLTPGPVVTNTVVMAGPAGLQQDTFAVHSWDSAANLDVLRRELSGPGPLRSRALRQWLGIEWLQSDPHQASQILKQALENEHGVISYPLASGWNIFSRTDLDMEGGPQPDYRHLDVLRGATGYTVVEGDVTLNGRPASRVMVAVGSLYSPNQTPSDDLSLEVAKALQDQRSKAVSCDRLAACGADPDWFYQGNVATCTDDHGHFALAVNTDVSPVGLSLRMAGGSLARATLPCKLHLRSGHVTHVGTLELWR